MLLATTNTAIPGEGDSWIFFPRNRTRGVTSRPAIESALAGECETFSVWKEKEETKKEIDSENCSSPMEVNV